LSDHDCGGPRRRDGGLHASSAHELRVELLGPVRAHSTTGIVGGLTGRRTQELLCYLLLHASRPVRREVLADRLWGESDDAQPRKQLRQALWLLHHALDDAGVPDMLDVTGEWIRLDRPESVWADIWALEDAFRTCSHEQLDPSTLHQARAAVELYRGDLLDGCYLSWCLLERERCRTMYLAVLDRLLASAVATGDFVAGTAYGNAILREDRAHERTHRCLMQLQADRGDRTGALRQYDACRQALAEELGVEPAPATNLLRESLWHVGSQPVSTHVGSIRVASVLEELTLTLERAQTLLRSEIARRDTV
jgi:DNA-binding SARP family transcriptional activator